MLPGFIAGHYSYDESHIDLRPLAKFCGARLIHVPATFLQLENKHVICGDRPPIRYDVLSINTGSTPSHIEVPGSKQHALAVKPINEFLQGWDALMQNALERQGDYKVVVVGAGAGGVEVALATQFHLRKSNPLDASAYSSSKSRRLPKMKFMMPSVIEPLSSLWVSSTSSPFFSSLSAPTKSSARRRALPSHAKPSACSRGASLPSVAALTSTLSTANSATSTPRWGSRRPASRDFPTKRSKKARDAKAYCATTSRRALWLRRSSSVQTCSATRRSTGTGRSASAPAAVGASSAKASGQCARRCATSCRTWCGGSSPRTARFHVSARVGSKVDDGLRLCLSWPSAAILSRIRSRRYLLIPTISATVSSLIPGSAAIQFRAVSPRT